MAHPVRLNYKHRYSSQSTILAFLYFMLNVIIFYNVGCGDTRAASHSEADCRQTSLILCGNPSLFYNLRSRQSRQFSCQSSTRSVPFCSATLNSPILLRGLLLFSISLFNISNLESPHVTSDKRCKYIPPSVCHVQSRKSMEEKRTSLISQI